MMRIRPCDRCNRRIRTTGRAARRTRRCPYCKAEATADIEPHLAITPTRAEWAVFGLGLLTELVGVVLASTVLVRHERFAMSWVGSGIVSAILASLLIASGRVARVGSPGEIVGRNIIALLLLHALILYGSFAFPPLDAWVDHFMAIVAAFCIIVVGGHDGKILPRDKAAQARSWSWFILLGFVAAYGYHAVQGLLER